MKNKRMLALLVGLVVGIASLTGCGGGNTASNNASSSGAAASSDASSQEESADSDSADSAASETEDTGETYEVRLIHSYTEQGPVGRNMVKFKEVVEEKTNGRVQITIYPNGQITSADKELSLVQDGAVEAAYVAAGSAEVINPLHQVYMIPFLMETIEPGDMRMIEAAFKSDILEGKVREKAEEAGYTLLSGNFAVLQGNYIFANNKRPVEKLSDANGMKIRVPAGEMISMIIESLGASPVTMAASETAIGLSQGVVDGAWGSTLGLTGENWVVKYLTLPYCCGNVTCMYFNQDWWNALPSDLQDQMREAVDETAQWCWDTLSVEEASELEVMQEEWGTEISYLDMDDPEVVEWITDLQTRGVEKFIEKTGDEGKELVNEALRIREELGLPNYIEPLD